MSYKTITTLAAAFAVLNLNPDTKPDVSAWPERYHAHKQHEFNVQMAIDAINGEWVADWNDTTQYKYFLWVRIVKNPNRVSGRGLALGGVHYDDDLSIVGPRLWLKTAALARFAGTKFTWLYEKYFKA